uniref:Uncharacterized protein n=1 Tax=Alexandrium andersonii TaxID=327968 RepID=A0A7S2AJI7_9DINO
MARFVFLSPTLHGRTENHVEQWISFDEPDPETKRLMSLLGKKDIDCITFKMAGMPLRWKVLWAWPVILVRFMITSVLAFVGFRFLMNSAGVIDQILNAVALFFIVELDLIMFTTFAKDMTRDIMDRLEPYRMPAERAKIESFVWKALRQEKSYTSWDVIRRTIRFSRVIVAVFFLQWMMFLGYFMSHCQMEAWPLASPMMRDKYYHDGSLLAWNWEFFTGQWRSKNITKRLWMQGPSNETLCAPHGNAGEIVGCGLPTPWHGPRG